MESIPETSLSDGAPKKSSLDDLSKEELVAKCKGLLILAQKAKQAKTELQNEVESYKKSLEKCKAEKKHNENNVQILQELVDSLTEQKLNFITEADLAQSKVRALKAQCDEFSEKVTKYENDMVQKDQQIAELLKKLSDYDNEVISLKRQNTRLEEENDIVIAQLTDMEARAAEFNAIGLQQREQLEMLEEKVRDNDSYQAEVEELNIKIKELENKLQSGDHEQKIFDYENKIKEVTQMYETEKVKKEKANIKLRSYRDKILKCAACINQLKNSRFILSKTVKDYSESIPKWQNNIMKASKVLESQVNELNNEKMFLKERIQQLEDELKSVDKDTISDELSEENKALKNELSNLTTELKNVTEVNKTLLDELSELRELQKQWPPKIEENKELKEKINELNQLTTELLKERNDLNDLVQEMKTKNECANTNNALSDELAALRDLQKQWPLKIEEIKESKEKINELNQHITELLKERTELNDLVQELKTKNESLDKSVHNKEVDTQAIDNLSLQIKALESEKAILVKEKLNARDSLVELENQKMILTDQVNKFKSEMETMKTKIDTLTQEKSALEANHKTEKESLNNNLKHELMELQNKYDLLKKDHDDLQDLNALLKEEVETLKLSLEQPHDDTENLSDLNVSLQADIVKLETKLAAYKQENAALLAEMKESRNKIKEFDSLTAEYEEAKSKLAGYKTENTELLNEMKEINQVLKERGESISKLQKAVSEMERLIETLEKDRENVNQEKEDLNKKIGTLEDDLKKAELKSNEDQLLLERDNALKSNAEKDNIIASLKDEIEKLKQNPNTSVTELPNEDMSTSTISKAEEHSRMKDLDESFEEKYSKLRVFALKLKKKLNEATAQLANVEQDKARLEKVVSDKTDASETKSVVCGSEGSPRATLDEKHRSQLEAKLATAAELSEKLSAELEQAKAELLTKTKELAAEVEAHKQTKDNLEKARREAKKKSVLSLEMEDYERSMKELTTKMEDSKRKMVQMESTIDTQESTITAMRTQIKLLEEQIRTEDNQIRMIKEELQHAVEEGKEKDGIIAMKNGLITKLEQDLEDEKRKNEEADLEMTTLMSEKEKVIMHLGEEKAELYNKFKRLEFKCEELTERLKISTIELADLKTEYTSYKVRAQAVLRQNQTIDHSQEEQLKEEAAALKSLIENMTAKLVSAQQQCEEHTAEMEACRRRAAEAGAEAARAAQRTARLQADLARLAHQLDSERAQHKLQISTLSQCYKNQITELETKHLKEIEAYRKQLLAAQENIKAAKVTSALDDANRNQYTVPVIPKDDGSDSEMDINVSMIPREEGEGSESAPSPPPSKSYLSGAGGIGGRSPVPLDRLLQEGVPEDETLDTSSLGLTPDQEISDLKRKLQAQQQRVKHVTILLSESERECARMAQLSELLKAELRRVRGSSQHAHNTEYMKNVTLKFLTLPPGDERSRLVPVLQKILTLSNEETHKIHAVAKGLDPNKGKGWGSYLPWPGAKS